ncbi:uncharacterized protein PG998_013284 [Apiospora kogelbergensis]|uniref:uncharacterized protein n=1 Tax=Apiospora kogelbergensis TaxID=1337665 RepID=UPI00312DF805
MSSRLLNYIGDMVGPYPPFSHTVSLLIATVDIQDGIWDKYDWSVDAFATYGATMLTPSMNYTKLVGSR